MTPQEQNLYNYHLENLYGPGKVIQGRDVSTLLQMSVEGPEDRYYNIPTVWQGRRVSPDEAVKRAQSWGWDYWPSYPSEKEAESRYQAMHSFIDRDTSDYMALVRSGQVR